MKLQCIIISLAIVGVSAISLKEYKKSIQLTNVYLAETYIYYGATLSRVIQQIVYGIERIDLVALLLAVPDLGGDLRDIVNPLQMALRTTLKTNIPDLQISEHVANQDLRLKNLGNARRAVTNTVIKTIIQNTLAESVLSSDKWMKLCRAAAVLRNTVYTSKCTNNVTVNEDGICLITFLDNTVDYANVANVASLTNYINPF